MKRKYGYLFTCLIAFPFLVFAQKDYTALVNPFIGTGGHGHTYPGASVPFGMMQLSPDTRMADWDGSSGYHYSDSVIYGFSHTHLSGTGIPDYCDVLLMPFTGEVKWDNKEYRSSFSHKNEKASPGYYEVLLDRNNIKVQLTTTTRAGMHQYSFPQSATEGSVLIDLIHRDELLDGRIEQVSDHEIKGYRFSKSWAQNQKLYFYIRFDQSITGTDSLMGKTGTTEGKPVKMSFRFHLPASRMIHCKVGISGISEEGARLNLDTEIKDWNFTAIREAAKKAWNKELGKIDIKGGSSEAKTVFYTALYHCFLVPNIYQDVDGQFLGTDLKPHQAKDFTNYSVFSLWDTYRAYDPLMTIINRKRTGDWIKTFLAQYQYGGMLPVWELSGNETFCMIGYHSVPVIVNAYKNGIRNFDTKLALQAMRSYAESNRFGLNMYREQGYLSNDIEHESVSKTLEYAYDDWCIASFAKMTGNDSVYMKYIKRAQHYKNVFDPETHHMRGKVQGSWYRPFDAREINNFYTEGNSWQYTFAVPQDIETLISLHGGKENFAAKLDELFTTSSQTTGRDQADVTGLIGQYAQGNEPSHHMAYLYAYVSEPWKTQELIHRICHDFYRNSPDGLIGNEDCGQMSAWYIMSAMGIYSVCPGSGEYVLGTPLFDEVKIHLENGKQFTITGNKTRKDDFYVKATMFNYKFSGRNYLLHEDIMKGGNLEFILTDTPGKLLGTKDQDLPHSKIEGEDIVPTPYFDISTNKFRDSLRVVIKDLDPSVRISISVFDSAITKGWQMEPAWPYSHSFRIDQSCMIIATAEKNHKSSRAATQSFYKVPNDRSITVLSKVHPMYTGGGPEALVDSIEGTVNWRAGDWQSYFDQDFEAVIEFTHSRQVNFAGVHVLQDVSPWILYPKEVIFYTSEDGKEFKEAGRVENKVEQKMGPPQMQELGIPISTKTKYLKVKAVNGGKLPSWHESAGNPSHLFIDEVIIR